jgi:hypothetical protein
MQNILHDQLAIQLWIEARTLTIHARLIGGDPLTRVAASWPWPDAERPPITWAAGEIADLATHALEDGSDLAFDRPRLLGQVEQALVGERLHPGRPRITLGVSTGDERTALDFGLVADMQGLAAAGVPCRITEDGDGPVLEILGHGWPISTLVAITGSRGWCDWERWDETRMGVAGWPVTRLSGLRRSGEPDPDEPDYLRDDPTARASFLIALEFGGAPFGVAR